MFFRVRNSSGGVGWVGWGGGGGGVNVRWNFHIPSIHTSSILHMFSRVRRTILCRFEPDQTRMCSDNVWLKTYHLLLSAKIRLVTYGV